MLYYSILYSALHDNIICYIVLQYIISYDIFYILCSILYIMYYTTSYFTTVHYATHTIIYYRLVLDPGHTGSFGLKELDEPAFNMLNAFREAIQNQYKS